MEKLKIDLVPQKIQNGTLTVKEAVNLICSFVLKNYPMFKLHKYDEDFRSEIYIYILEHGEQLLRNYNSEVCCFQKYLYYYIVSLTHTKIKSLAKFSIKESISYEENIEHIEERVEQYDKLNFSFMETPKAPYAPKVSSQDTITALERLKKSNNDKTILVLALKSSYYLTDDLIEKVCKIYNLDKEFFCDIIQQFRESVLKKAEKRAVAQQRRNQAYYNHKRCSKIIHILNTSDVTPKNQQLINNYKQKDIRYIKRWLFHNRDFANGVMLLRPTNKAVADLLELCERQVSYYIQCAKKYLEKKEAETSAEQQ